jgi:hypothetical protein
MKKGDKLFVRLDYRNKNKEMGPNDFKPLRYFVWISSILSVNIIKTIHFNLQLWYTLPIL